MWSGVFLGKKTNLLDASVGLDLDLISLQVEAGIKTRGKSLWKDLETRLKTESGFTKQWMLCGD